MTVIQLPKNAVKLANCRIIRSQMGYAEALTELSFGKAIRNTSWGNVEFTHLMDARKASGKGVKLSCTNAEFKTYVIAMVKLEAVWKKAVDSNNFKRLATVSKKLNKGLNQLLEWMPPELVPTDPNESLKP